VFPNTNNVRNANAERQARFLATPQGRTAAAVRNERLKLKRRAAKRLYHQQRRAAIIDCAGPGQRVRDVGAEGSSATRSTTAFWTSPSAGNVRGRVRGSPVDNTTEILTPEDVAMLLRVSESWVYEKSRRRCRDPLPCFRIGRYIRFSSRCDEVAGINRDRERRGKNQEEKIMIRSYQRAALAAVGQYYTDGCRRQLIVMPNGHGQDSRLLATTGDSKQIRTNRTDPGTCTPQGVNPAGGRQAPALESRGFNWCRASGEYLGP
jgi:hypothetical protein